MAYDQGGAEGIATKKALKAACTADPGSVQLYSTSQFGQSFIGSASQLPEGLTFNVVGPDPYRKRSWYASVTRQGDKVKVT